MLKVGIVGLGDIAQKAWLPIVTRTAGWQVAGAFSPNQQKGKAVCDAYRIPLFSSLHELAQCSDAVFVHCSTAAHFDVVKFLLKAGVDVCVDKPLAASYAEAEYLVELAVQRGRKLMVAFNRRFAPRYIELRTRMTEVASVRMDKHRDDGSDSQGALFTLLDDYLHVVDTAMWLCGGEGRLLNGTLSLTEQREMRYAEHYFSIEGIQATTSMHRHAGAQAEKVQVVGRDTLIEVNDMRTWHQQVKGSAVTAAAPSWQDLLEVRGFTGAAYHFIRCVENQTMPEPSGEQALMAQRAIEKMWHSAGLATARGS